ncbi:T9SS type A sorting domain-containing protein [Algibacter lectus]|uniref:Putative RTX toxin hemolysin-type calcium-binding protein n=1 Tax=Algibacter lectus TaxID=221126 RepID=A0A090VFQ8_9FLAO|nr:right-handed parallel beta-helix repeat-containing protein [Algibacter lectus]GAL63610.1 putative RTX toxin hemolysin-type calcium-binding protein [Algibacter lectus]
MNLPKLSFLFLLIITSSYNLKATNYYVSNSGLNSNTGLSQNDAFLTIQHAADLVIAGDTVFVENGIYVGFDLRNVNGTAANPIIFMGTGNSVLINQSGAIRNDGINIENANYIIIDSFIVNDMLGNGNGIRVVVSNNSIVRNCACDNNAERGIFTAFTDDILIEYNVCTNSIDEHGIYVSNSSDRPIIRYNECYGNNNVGIHLNGDSSAGGDGIISDALIYGNNIHDNNGAAGINMDGLQNPTVYNNLIYNNHSSQGISLFQQDGAIVTNGAKIYNNTIIVPSDGRWGILLQNGANINTEIYNNIIINQHAWRGCIAINNTAMFTSDNNILNDKMSNKGDGSTISLAAWQALGLDTNSLLASSMNSIFVDPTLNDFNLATDSQAIDTGTNLVSTIVTYDINGNTRPKGINYDIGAYEFDSTLSTDNNATIFKGIAVYPNPTSGIINTKIKNLNNIILYDITGRFIKIIEPKSSIDLTELPNGIYLLKFISNEREFITKVIKE